MAIAGVRAAWQVQSMDHTSEAVAIATEYLREGETEIVQIGVALRCASLVQNHCKWGEGRQSASGERINRY